MVYKTLHRKLKIVKHEPPRYRLIYYVGDTCLSTVFHFICICVYLCPTLFPYLMVFISLNSNMTGLNTLPTIWYTYMMLVTKYQISTINSYWEKCDEKYLGRTEGRTDDGYLTDLYIHSINAGLRPIIVIIPPLPRRRRGVYCFTSVRPSVRPRYFSSHFSQ
jgi:hypothetical protein